DSMFLPFGAEGNGGGLGLSVAWGIVQQLGGTLQADPSDEEGNSIEFHIPRTPREKSGPGETSEAPPAACVLLVEDEPAVLRLTSRILRARGYDVLSASSAAEALRLVDENEGRINVLLTDVIMPGQSGTELARRLCETNPEIRILFMSGFSKPSVPAADILLEYPMLKKPFTPDMLGRFVHDALGPQEGR
ncbi:MAG: response regulator, partial [Gemmatimonadales bacterium]